MDPQRILHVFGSLNRGGAETMVMNLYREVDKKKIQFDFVVHTETVGSYEKEIEKLGGRIYRVPRFKGYNFFQYIHAWNRLLRFLDKHRIVHCHIRSTANIILYLAKRYKRVTIAHSHNTSNGKGISAIVKNVFQKFIRSDYYFACSQEAGEWLFGKKICNSSKFYVLKNAININKFKRDKLVRKVIREELGLEDKFVIGTVGRMTEQKNPFYILEVFNEILGIRDDAFLMWIGEGELLKDIVQSAKLKSIYKNIKFLGSVANVEQYMQAFDIFLFPSKWEGLPLVLVEAQAANLPCVISDVINDEVVFSKEVIKISLRESKLKWAEIIANCKYNKMKENTVFFEITQRGYNIENNIGWLERFYKKIS